MITKEDIKYELEYLENIVPDIIEKAHTDEIIVWVTGSGCNPSNTFGRYRMIMQYNSTKKYFEGNEEGATANQAYLYGIISAVEKISKPSRICAVVPLSLGFETAFKGKGTNAKIINKLYELIKEKGCTFTEVRCDNGADVIKRFISASSGKSELVREEVEKALSSVKGIYMIVDGNTGKMYIGSAYGNDGIWGRWNSYANSYHGGNCELIKLYEENGEEYFYKFKYLILQILPAKVSDKEIIEIEAKYKKRFLTREFGWNAN